MHERQAGVVRRCGRGMTREYVWIGLRCIQTENASEHTHETIFEIRKLGGSLSAVSVQDDEGMKKMGVGAEVVDTAEDGIVETCIRISRPWPRRAFVTAPSAS